MMSRRVFCVLAGASLAAPRDGLDSGIPETRDWLYCIQDREAAARIGSRIRSKMEEPERRICAEAMARLNDLAGKAHPELLRSIVADEFRRGKTLTVEGVVFSRTEVALCDHACRAGFSS